MNALVLNKDATSIQNITTNLLANGCRIDTLEGKEYTVVPMVILTEGVHSGSMGPIYYPKSELQKTPEHWNMKPVVVYHPTMNGQGISACEQHVIESRRVGLMMNTRFEEGKLKSEAWIDVTKANKVDERIMATVKAGEMMELSTGVFVDVDDQDGIWNKEAYSAIARNYRADHLALLPDQIGACSIADGAGFLRNQSESLSDLRKKLAVKHKGAVINRVEKDFVFFTEGDKQFRLGYTANGSEVELSEETPVEGELEFKPTDNKAIKETPIENDMEKNKLIDAIIANSDWTEEDREALTALSDEQVQRIHDKAIVKNEAPKEEKKDEAPANNEAAKAEKKEEAQPVANAQPEEKKEVSLGEYIANAPAELRDVLNESVSSHNAEKQRVVDSIMQNERNIFSEEELKTRPLGELKKMAALMAPAVVKEGEAPAPNYSGQAPTPAANAGVEEALELPAMNYAKK